MSRFTLGSLVSANFDDALNWNRQSLVNPTYRWTVSGSGTGEYYLELAAGGNPNVSSPTAVYADGTALTTATLGALTAGTYNYGDNDTLGYSTIYVRLTDSTDPDTKTSDFVTYAIAPVANDDLGFTFASGTLGGSDQSDIEYDDIEVFAECTGNAGSQDDYLKLDQGTANTVVFAGLGTWYLDMGTSGSASVRVDQTAVVTQGKSGLYFRNDTNAITLFQANSGTTRLVSANITTLVVGQGASVVIDKACTIPTVINNGGTITDKGAAITTWKQNSGTSIKQGSDDFALSMYGGTFYWDGTGTCTATTYGGLLDANRDAQTKTLVLTQNGGTVLKGANTAITDTLNAPVQITAISG